MRKIVLRILMCLTFSGFSSCKEEGSKVETSDLRNRLVNELELSSREGNLQWNIPYRKALILANRPMGSVFDYGISFAEFNRSDSKTELWVHVGIIYPEELIKKDQMQLHLDKESFPVSKYDVLRDASDGQVGAEIDVYFEIPMKEFISSKKIWISIGKEKDLLVSDKKSLNEKILSWHSKIVKGEIKRENAILLGPIRF